MRRLALILVAVCVAASACVGGDAAAPSQGSRTTVEIFGPFRGHEAELLAASLEPFERASGIEIRYTGTGSFISDLRAQLRVLDPPDIALIPQPGLIREFVDAGRVAELAPPTLEALEANFSSQTRALAEIDGVPVGVPFQLSLKSLVWYRPEIFEDLDLEVPTTLDELETLLDQVEEAGVTPWCLGIESQAATGWVATDWTEDLVLRLAGPGVYDAWIRGDVRFANQAIANAYARFEDLALVQGRVAGGINGVLRTSHLTSPLGLFGDAPACVLHRQANFVVNSFPPDLTFGPEGDIDFFVLPGVDDDVPAPLLVGSVAAVGFDDRPEVAAVMTHLANPSSTAHWVAAGGFLQPHSTGNQSELAPVDRAAIDVIAEAEVIRADASDAMAPEIGTQLLWQQITSWLVEDISFEQLAETIDTARDPTPDEPG